MSMGRPLCLARPSDRSPTPRFRGRTAGALLLVLAGLAVPCSTPAAQVIEADICIYGGTSGGVIAAVQAARMGKSAVVIEPGRHVGGMTASGLGATDSGHTDTIGGLAREFYRRVGQHYGISESFTFEPHVAEQVFLAFLQEAGVPVHYQQRLAAVAGKNQRITALTMESGDEFRAKMFIDATYEGDLLAMAGVSFIVGRESSAAYGESLNGIRPPSAPPEFLVPVNPYVAPGDPGSGLLPFIQSGDGGSPGDGDHRIPAYNFRLCLTQVETNRMPILPPPGYEAARYELLGRYVQALVNAGRAPKLSSFLFIVPMPNGKTDVNNTGAVSTDAIGMNYSYPTNSPAGRAVTQQEHEDYIRGLLHFLATDSRVPAGVRTNLLTWGLCRDEFKDTGGWPHQLYVREARRMVSDYVMTQSNCLGLVSVPDSIALSSYQIDSHHCQRFAKDGIAVDEGAVGLEIGYPFPVSYRAIIPRAGECENLLATFCLSATHIAFSSCRMEPVFMMTSQSAASAAALAIDDDVSVQDLPYGKLRLQLMADRQVLQWDGSVLDSEQPTGITTVGRWTSSSTLIGYTGNNYLHDGNTNKGGKSVRYVPNLPASDTYTVYLRWTAHPNRAANVPLTLTYAGGITNLTVDQRYNSGVWMALATLPFAAGRTSSLLLRNNGTDGYVIADGAKWVPASAPPPTTVEVIASDCIAAEGGANPAMFHFVRSPDATGAMTVYYTASGTATPGADFPMPSGSLVIPPGHYSTAFTLGPLDDNLAEGDETLTLTVAPGTDYQTGTYSHATAVLRDGGFGLWRVSRFTPELFSTEGVSGATADPDGDLIPNQLEFFLGSEPRTANVPTPLWLDPVPGGRQLAWRRAAAAADLYLRLETTRDLSHWVPAPFSAQVPLVSDDPPFQDLRFPLGNPASNSERGFYRVVISHAPLALTTNTARFFFSFDSAPEGTGTFRTAVTASDGFTGVPAATRTGTLLAEAGGAPAFTDFTGVTWLGSGSASAPGHCLAFNPGSTGNQFLLAFSTLGLRQIRVRMDVSSAVQAGGVAPDAFTSFTYDVGGGPQPVPGVNLRLAAINRYQQWTADLADLPALDNQRVVTLSWTLKDLTSWAQESLRIDNIEVTAAPIGN